MLFHYSCLLDAVEDINTELTNSPEHRQSWSSTEQQSNSAVEGATRHQAAIFSGHWLHDLHAQWHPNAEPVWKRALSLRLNSQTEFQRSKDFHAQRMSQVLDSGPETHLLLSIFPWTQVVWLEQPLIMGVGVPFLHTKQIRKYLRKWAPSSQLLHAPEVVSLTLWSQGAEELEGIQVGTLQSPFLHTENPYVPSVFFQLLLIFFQIS